MKRAITMVLTLILFVLGILMVFARPWDVTAISLGMFLVAISVLNIAVQIYFPQPQISKNPIRLKVVEPVAHKAITKTRRSVRKKRTRKRK
jgi:hypothetical protein